MTIGDAWARREKLPNGRWKCGDCTRPTPKVNNQWAWYCARHNTTSAVEARRKNVVAKSAAKTALARAAAAHTRSTAPAEGTFARTPGLQLSGRELQELQVLMVQYLDSAKQINRWAGQLTTSQLPREMYAPLRDLPMLIARIASIIPPSELNERLLP